MIYCVEDDDSIRELMLYALRASGFEAEGFRDSVGLFDALSHAQPQLIIDLGDAKDSIAKDMDTIQKQTGIPTIFIDETFK